MFNGMDNRLHQPRCCDFESICAYDSLLVQLYHDPGEFHLRKMELGTFCEDTLAVFAVLGDFPFMGTTSMIVQHDHPP